MRNRTLLIASIILSVAVGAHAQVRVVEPAASGTVNVTWSHPEDEPQALRLRDLVFRVKPVSDALHPVEEVSVVIVHSQRELDLQLGPDRAGDLAGASYVRGILFLSPLSWLTSPTDEALESRMEEAMVRYAALNLAGGHRLPEWLDEGLVRYLTKQPFAPTTAAIVAARAEVLLSSWEADDPAIGFWAVRFLVEERGGLPAIQRLLRIMSMRPDTFRENMELVYSSSVGQLERDWRAWLNALVEEDRRQREGGVRRIPSATPRKR